MLAEEESPFSPKAHGQERFSALKERRNIQGS
jgi:hypothetical protein